ncbi:MAG: hypothetical protein V1806_13595 [Pseudomonadota bacterium]
MKKFIAMTALFIWALAAPALAEEFGTLPIMDGGQVVKSNENELIKEYNLAPQAVWEYYKGILSQDKEIRFTDRGHLYTIEDLGSRPWRRIAITKTQPDKTMMTVDMLTWKWIMIMLSLRFMAVFVVLLVLYLATFLGTSLLARLSKEPVKQGA